MKARIYQVVWLTLFCSCKSDSPAVHCNENLITKQVTFEALISNLPRDVVTGLAKEPTAEGALGRNKDGYFHVRFQMDISFLASYATRFGSDEALSKFILSTEYCFAKQKPAGDFELIIPASLLYLGQPANGDLSSGISFFMSALGQSLVLLEQSGWYKARPIDQLANRLNNLKPKFQLALNFLKTQKGILKAFDADAPNRLFFDAMAFYAMGTYLNDSQAKAMGIEFIELALAQQKAAGFYTEGAGFDSSYNGVSIRLALTLLGIMRTQETVYDRLRKSISCSVQWQASRILSTGEISLQGNIRVYPGGEEFLGQVKTIAWIDTLLAFYFTSTFSSDDSYPALAQKVQAFYN
jgi:hypothetical protein